MKFPSNLNCDGKIVSEMVPWRKIHEWTILAFACHMHTFNRIQLGIPNKIEHIGWKTGQNIWLGINKNTLYNQISHAAFGALIMIYWQTPPFILTDLLVMTACAVSGHSDPHENPGHDIGERLICRKMPKSGFNSESRLLCFLRPGDIKKSVFSPYFVCVFAAVSLVCMKKPDSMLAGVIWIAMIIK